LTGFYNSGADTIARALQCALDQEGTRRTTLFLGESIQQAKEISMTPVDQQHVNFSYKPAAERLADIETLAFCASQVSKNGGVAILTPLIGTAESRAVSKKIVEEECAGVGGYYVVHVNTPLDACEANDRLGVYSAARSNKISSKKDGMISD
jgi:sulfate adenylyltransferase